MIAAIKKFLKLESATGIILVATAITAIIFKNSSLHIVYSHLLETRMAFILGDFQLSKPLLLWINDGLMAIFFFLVGLEIKREILRGHLSTISRLSLPLIAACGGLLFPALIFSFITNNHPHLLKGWAIPAATDIAFAIGVMALLGKRVPKGLKITLSTIAVIDDLAAIIIIALFYTSSLSLFSLAFALPCLAILYAFNRFNVTNIAPYILVGIVLWVSVLKSGVHATLAGVVLAFFIPLRTKNKSKKSPAESLEHALQPWVSYIVLPLFAFANAGFSFKGIGLQSLTNTLTLAIALGLFFGKQLGVMLFTFIAVKGKICILPQNTNWGQYYGMALITGIGFTMSLFIGSLAFESIENITQVRIGVVLGSILSGIVGYIVLRIQTAKNVNIKT